MIMIPVMVIIMMMIIIIIIVVILMIIIIIIIIIIIVKAKLKLFSDVVQADYPSVLISKFLSFFSVFVHVSATLPYNLGSTDNQHHFSDANYKVTLTLKFCNTMKLTIVLLVGPKAIFYLGPERPEAIWWS